jgi:hypothetical protein
MFDQTVLQLLVFLKHYMYLPRSTENTPHIWSFLLFRESLLREYDIELFGNVRLCEYTDESQLDGDSMLFGSNDG